MVTNIVENLKLFHKPCDVIEVRIIKQNGTTAGYYKDFVKVATDINSLNGKANIYFVLNEIQEPCYHRQPESLKSKIKKTTTDNDIANRNWILLDFDPKRPTDISSTDEEKEASHERMKASSKFLKEQGFPLPIVADSGNGWHNIYPIDLPNSNDTRDLIKQFLQVMDSLFSDDKVEIDTSVFNAARITKLYGTTAVKGANTKERPHRQSGVTFVPDNIKPVPVELIKKVADMLPKPEPRKSQQNSGSEEFKLDDWINDKGIRVNKVSSWSNGTKYVLDECPFNPAHGKDSAIIQLSNGAIFFHCFHNGCQGNTWQDLRQKYDPGCYDKQFEDKQVYKDRNSNSNEYHNKKVNLSVDTTKALPEDIKKLLGMAIDVADVEEYNPENAVIVNSGIPTLDSIIGGFEMGLTTVWTGINAAGKSTVLGQAMIEAVEQGFNVFAFSGELQAHKFQYWIDLQAAGADSLIKQISRKTNKEYYSIRQDAKRQIHNWYRDHLFLYDNKCGLKYEEILKVMDAYAVYKNCKVFLIDNLMRLDLRSIDRDQYEAQSQFANSVSDFAQKRSIHAHIVAHPRKVMGSIITKMDVSGSGDLTNRADNVLAVHRVTPSFREEFMKAKNQLSKAAKEEIMSCTNLIEIFKSRDAGVQDKVIPLIYCEGSKRLIDKTHMELENKQYGWQKQINKSDADDSDFYYKKYLNDSENGMPF